MARYTKVLKSLPHNAVGNRRIQAAAPAGGPGGSDTQVQFNDGGLFGGDAGLTYNKTTDSLVLGGSLYITEKAAAGTDTAGLGQLWVKNEAPNELYFTNDNGEDIQITSTTHLGPTEQIRLQVRNDEGSTIPAGAPLYSKGEIGGSERILVGIADASDSNKMPCIGIAFEEMNTTSTKDNFAVLTGVYNTSITITSVIENDIIYVAPHGGSPPYLTVTKPTSASHLIQNVGTCIRQNVVNTCAGMNVSSIGRTNDVPNSFDIVGPITTDSFVMGGITTNDILISSDASSTSDTALVTAGYVDAHAVQGDIGGTISNDQVAFGASTANTIEGSSNLTFDGTTLTYTSTDAGSAAGPELDLFRNSASPAAADYIGQVRFLGESSTGVQRTYAKITGKIGDPTNAAEDGIIEMMTRKNGSNNIAVRLTESEFKIMNDTDFSVDTNTLYVDSTNNRVGILNASPAYELDLNSRFFLDGGHFRGSDTNGPSMRDETPSDTNPVFTFNNDVDTGMGRAAANELSLITAGTEAIRINSSQKVGIGTAAPTEALHVYSPDTGNQLGLYSDANEVSALNFYENTTKSAELLFDPSANDLKLINRISGGDMIFRVENNTEAMRILNDGNVGIGTTTPTDKLNINTGAGTFDFRDYNMTYSTSLGIRAEGSGYLGLVTEGSNEVFLSTNGFANKRLRVTSAGDVTLGGEAATVNGARLHVNASTQNLVANFFSTDGIGEIRVGDNYTDASHKYTRILNVGSQLKLMPDNGAEMMNLDGSAYKTTLLGETGGNSPKLIFDNPDASNDIQLTQADSGWFGLSSDGGTTQHFVLRTGNVGIGTEAPDEKLDVRGDIQLKQTGDTAVTVLGDANRSGADSHIAALRGKWNGTAVGTFMVMSGPDTTNKDDGQLTFQTASAGTLAERMRIDETGNVGIGITSPTSKLHVKGTLDIQDGNQTILMGAGNSSTARSNDTLKLARVGLAHYHNAEEPVAMLYAASNGTDNTVVMGGGTSNMNAATKLQFATAANDATTAGTTRMQIGSDGNVGIGTTSPAVALDVRGSGWPMAALHASSRFGTGLQLYNSHTTQQDWAIIGGGSTYNYAFRVYDQTDATYRFAIDRDGKVGIGGTNAEIVAPDTALHIRSSTASEPVVTIENSNADNNPPGLTFFKNTASPASSDQVGSIKFDSKEATSGDTKTYWEIQSRINDPTNTTPNGQLNFYGLDGDSPGFIHQFQFINSQFSVLDSNGVGPTISCTGTNGGTFKTAGTKMRLQAGSSSNGEIHMMANYVGINTTSPSEALDVNGNVEVTGTISATAKSFNIPHPLYKDKRLVHGSLEGPEHGIYIRGTIEATEGCVIELPEYWQALCDEYTVQLTPHGPYTVFIQEKQKDKVMVASSSKDYKFDYFIVGKRTDEEFEVVQNGG